MSYLVIPIAILLLFVNLFLRLKIIKSYKKLKAFNIDLAPDMVFKFNKAKAFLSKKYPEHGPLAIKFLGQIRTLVFITFAALVLISIIFLVNYMDYRSLQN